MAARTAAVWKAIPQLADTTEVAGWLAEKMSGSESGSLSEGSCAQAVVPTVVLA